jgi:YVTN family beta-propeller protein
VKSYRSIVVGERGRGGLQGIVKKTPPVLLFLFSLTTAVALNAFAQAPKAQLLVLSNSQPNVTVIDAETYRVINTANVPNLTSWTWIDDNNYFDGRHLWGGMRNPTTNDVEVVLLDVSTLQIVDRISLGQDAITLYIGKASRTGKLFVAKQASRQLAVIDLKTRAVERMIDLPLGDGGTACDVDVAVAIDGKERAFVPALAGNRIVAVDTETGQVSQVLDFPEGTRPFMLTATPDGRRLWVEEQRGNSNVVLNTLALQLVERIPVGTVPIIGTFSPDGKVHFTGHNSDVVIANDAATFAELWRTKVGSVTNKLGVHPSGKFVYTVLSNEGAVAVLDATTGNVVTRINLGTNPTGLFVRKVN